MGISFYRKSLDEIKGDTDWSAAEEQLQDEAHTGFVFISETRPDTETDDNKIRAELIRHITLGGCEKLCVPEKGVALVGVFIIGELDLQGCDTPLDLKLLSCRFDTRPMLPDARLGALYLPGCALPGIDAHRLRVTRDVLLNRKFECKGAVDLIGARVGGQLNCNDGKFDGQGGPALNMDAVTIGADLFLRDGFEAKGFVNLARATIQGSLRLNGGRFEGGIDAEALTVRGPFHLHDLKSLTGLLDLTDAHVGRLHDDADAWKSAEPLILNGFRYDRLTGSPSIGERLSWLATKQENPILPALRDEAVTFDGQRYGTPMPYRRTDFGTYCDPPPYTQLAKVLREQGMALGAARVLEARDRRVLDATFNRRMAAVDGSLAADVDAALALIKRPFDWLFGAMFGYGHRPGRTLFAVLGILAINWALYAQLWEAGQMAPASDVVLTSEAWTRHVALMPDGALDTSVNTLRAWTDSEAAKDYTTFNAALYALDLFIPLDALGQEAAWAPSPVRGFWGTIGFATGWLTQLSGWLITAIAAAAVAGIVGRKD